MFVPVNCTNCAKPFQVPEAALGKLAPCPWCQEVVTALPVSTVAASQEQSPAKPQTSPDAPSPAASEPLSLDDEPAPKPKPPTAKPVTPAQQQKLVPAAAPNPRRRWLSLALMLIFGAGIAIAVTVVTVGALKRKTGNLVRAEWRTFHSPDGSCSVDLLGSPVEDQDAPASGGRRYQSEGWYSGTKTWIGWKDLSSVEARMAAGADSWQLLRPSVINPEKDRLKSEFGGYEAEGGGTKSFDPIVVEYRLQTPNGLLVERIMIKHNGPRPRAYFVGIMGRGLTPDGPELNRLFTSFRVND